MVVALLLLFGMSAKAVTTITVGAIGADQTTIAGAYSAITDATGGYLIELQSDYSPAGETFPITLGFKTGSTSEANRITIQPKAGNTSTFTFTTSTASQLFKLDGAKYVTIDGLNKSKFVLINTVAVATASNAILLTNDASYNIITNLTAQGQSNVAQISLGAVIQLSAGATNVSGCDNNTIDNCDVTETSSSTRPLIGIACYTGTTKHDNFTVQNCNIANVKSTSSNDAYGIAFASGANNGVIKNNRIYWTDISSISTKITYGILMAAGNTNCNIESNVVGYANNSASANAANTGSIGSTFIGINLGSSAGAFPSVKNNTIGGITTAKGFLNFTGIQVSSSATSAVSITGNTIKDVTYTDCNTATIFKGLYFSSATGFGAQTVTGNEVSNINLASATAASTIAIRAFQVGGTAATTNRNAFSQNKVFNITAGNSSSSAANTVYGFDVLSSTSTIERSLIYDLKAINNTTTATVFGISTSGSNGDATGTVIKNNMIDLGVNIANDAVITGINQGAASTAGQKFYYYHNSVFIGGTAPASAIQNTYAFARGTTGLVQSNEIKNNIFVNKRTYTGTTTAYNCGLYTNASTDFAACDYNIIYVSGATNGAYGRVGTTYYTNWSTTAPFWQGALTPANDANSYISDPKFVSATGAMADLHINTAVPSIADGNGIYISTVNKDYDNNDRLGAIKADIGADEYEVTLVYSQPTVTTTVATSITRATATSVVSITSDGNVTVGANGIIWSTNANPDLNTAGVFKTINGSGSITDLTAGTLYYYRAYATNNYGTGYGDVLSFTTKDFDITATPADLNGTVVGAGSYYNGATVTLVATPVSGKRFVSWTDAGVCVSVNRTISFTATASRILVANFGDTYTIYYVRPAGSSAWGNISATADQIMTTDNFNLAYTTTNIPDGSAKYYFAAGNYTLIAPAATGTQLTSGKIYGGFSGNETTTETESDLNARATSDLDGNGIVEPWEMTNATVFTGRTGFKYADAGTTDGERLIRIDGGGEVNGVTLSDFNYGLYGGAISVGLPASNPSSNIVEVSGALKRCIVKKIKSAIGAVMLTNTNSVVDQCLIEDNITNLTGTSTFKGNGGAIYFNRFGGTVSNSVIRNNKALAEAGAIFAGNPVAATDLKAIVSNCLIYNNEATTKGGAVSSKSIDGTHGGVEIINSTIVNNTTGTGNASIEFDGPGLLVNSIVTGDAKADLYATSATNYVGGVSYGTLSGTSALLNTSSVTSGKTVANFMFTSATATPGYLDLSGVNYDAMRKANFKISSDLSAASITPVAIPTGHGFTTYGVVPTTDMLGATIKSNTIGAYQFSGVVSSVENANLSKSGVFAGANEIIVPNATGNVISIYTITGQLVKSVNATSNRMSFASAKGIYIVKVGTQVSKVSVK